jgi:hypothetical protein
MSADGGHWHETCRGGNNTAAGVVPVLNAHEGPKVDLFGAVMGLNFFGRSRNAREAWKLG